MHKRLILIRTLFGVSTLFALIGCNPFHKHIILQGFGYEIDECDKRDRTHHGASYADGTSPGRLHIWQREFRCRIERVCVGKSEVENEKCRQAARNYWISGEGGEKSQVYKDLNRSDDQFDAICTLNQNPWNPNFKGCSPKWKSQENYKTNPYWNEKTKSYVLPEAIKTKLEHSRGS